MSTTITVKALDGLPIDQHILLLSWHWSPGFTILENQLVIEHSLSVCPAMNFHNMSGKQ